MSLFRPAPEVSIAEANEADAKRLTPKKESNESARRKRRTFPQASMLEHSVADSPIARSDQDSIRISWDSYRGWQFPSSVYNKSIEFQQEYIRACAKRPDTFHSKLDDISRYGLSASQEARLWMLETERLAAAFQWTFDRVPFTSGTTREWLADDAGFKILSSSADEIIKHIAICDLDNKLVWPQGYYGSFDGNKASLARTEIAKARQTVMDGNAATTSQTEINISVEQRRKFYCALVDYVTAMIAIHGCHNEVDDQWRALWITSLARLAAKLKFLAVDSEGHTNQSLHNAENIEALGSRYSTNPNKGHFAMIASASSWALGILLSISRDIRIQEKPGVLDNIFNTGIFVYETGWKDVPIILSQDQYGEISGTSAKSAARSAITAFETLSHNLRFIEVETADSDIDLAGLNEPERASIKLEHLEHQSYKDPIWVGQDVWTRANSLRGGLHTLGDILFFMVPLLLMQPKRLQQLNLAANSVTKTTIASAQRRRDYHKTSNTELPAFAEVTVCMKESNDETYIRMSKEKFGGLSRLFNELSTVPALKGRALDVRKRSARNWAIEEKCIVVKRRFYVTMTMVSCVALIAGGISAGLLVGERIPGVDPFNIATFAWVLAAFIILIAKSLSVREWPWSYFLRGQVPCRSVSELHTVTGIDEQDILKYLLANDAYAMLTTRGPFNHFFTRRSEDGFSIDIKMELRTLIASGIVVIRVAADMGPALVCLDLRRGIEGRTSLRHFDGPREDERLLGCFDFPEAIDGPLDVQIHTLSQSMTWTQIMGIYDVMDKKFR